MACGCHDWRVFGHQVSCGRQLGPAVAGGGHPSLTSMSPEYRAEFRRGIRQPVNRVTPGKAARLAANKWHIRMGLPIPYPPGKYPA